MMETSVITGNDIMGSGLVSVCVRVAGILSHEVYLMPIDLIRSLGPVLEAAQHFKLLSLN